MRSNGRDGNGMVAPNGVMRNKEERNARKEHNESITARPRIFFRAKSGEFDHVIGGARFAEFTTAHTMPGTPEYREWEKSTTQIDPERLQAPPVLRNVHAQTCGLSS